MQKMATDLVALVASLLLYNYPTFKSTLAFPSSKGSCRIWRFLPLPVIFVIVGTSNAVNLTDGLDGLATGRS